MAAGHVINKDELLFAKIEDSEIQAQIDKLSASKAANASANAVTAIAPS
jgi:methionyl-tRNA synthetase